MDLSVRTEAFTADDHSWLGSAHGTDANRSITLNLALFDLAGNFPNGFIPSGVGLGKVTASGLYGPYDDAAVDGRQTMVGMLFGAVEAKATGATKVGAALYEHGKVRLANLPTHHGVDAAGQADVIGRIQFI